ncbi:MAG: GxxExxY protein [Victivallaceae bacterium]|nr:GxxExxY protein [Victivallaceae bacterium]
MSKEFNNREKHEKVLFSDECYAIQGAVFDVYKEMGCGFLEAVYQECLEKELHKRNISFQSQVELGLLVNFGSYPKIEIIRMANSNFRDFSAFRGLKRGAE